MGRRYRQSALVLSGVVVALLSAPPPALAQVTSSSPEAPVRAIATDDRWAAEMAAFEEQDRAHPFEPGGTVFVGSSSIKRWDLAFYFPGMTLLNRGFGGSTLADSLDHLGLLVLKHQPRTVIVYAGENDLARGRSAEDVAADFKTLVLRVREAVPNARIAFISMKPSLARREITLKLRTANTIIKQFVDEREGLTFIDVDHPMLGWDRQPRPDLFVEDGLHMTPKGYHIWVTLVRPLIE